MLTVNFVLNRVSAQLHWKTRNALTSTRWWRSCARTASSMDRSTARLSLTWHQSRNKMSFLASSLLPQVKQESLKMLSRLEILFMRHHPWTMEVHYQQPRTCQTSTSQDQKLSLQLSLVDNSQTLVWTLCQPSLACPPTGTHEQNKLVWWL